MNLYKHQQKIIDEDPKWKGLFLGTGSSKTRIALELAQGKTLIIAPKMQVEDKVWERENKKWNINKNLTILSKETFRRDVNKLPRFDTVIVDEAHHVLGVTPNTRQRKKIIVPRASQLFEALQSFLNTNPVRFYLVTATPAKSPMAVWAIGTLLKRRWDFFKWRNTFYTKLPIPLRDIWVPKHDTETKERLGKIVQSLGYTGRLQDYFDVPEQIYKNIYVSLTDEQQKRLKELPMEFPDPLVLVGKKHSVENGILNGDEFNDDEVFKNNKDEKILEYAEEFPRMIIFAKYSLQIKHLSSILKANKYPVFTLTGETKDRGELITRLKNLDKYILIVQSQISEGWELPLCEVMIFASRSYSFVHLDQAYGRILRSNHLKKNLYINLIVKGGVDEEVNKCLDNKKDFSEKIYATRK